MEIFSDNNIKKKGKIDCLQKGAHYGHAVQFHGSIPLWDSVVHIKNKI